MPTKDPDSRNQHAPQLSHTVQRDDPVQHALSRSATTRSRRGHQHEHGVRSAEPSHRRCGMGPTVVQPEAGIQLSYVVTLGKSQAELPCGVVIELRRSEYVLAQGSEQQRRHRCGSHSACGARHLHCRGSPHRWYGADHVPSSTRS